MALKDITQKILDDASVQRDDVIGQTEALVADMESIAAHTRTKHDHEAEKQAAEASAQVERSELSRARRDARRTVAGAKRAVLERVFAHMNAHTRALDDTEYRALLEKMFAHLETSLAVDRVSVPTGRSAVTRAVLEARGYTVSDVTEDDAMTAGAILIGPDANYDFSFDRLIADGRTKLEPFIAQELFSENA